MATMTLEDMTFENYTSKVAILITSGGTYTLDNCQFDGSGTYEIEIDSGVTTPTTISLTNGSTALVLGDIDNNGSSSVTIENNVTISIHVTDEGGSDVENAQTAVYQTSDDTQLMNEDTNSSGIASETFNYSTDTNVYIRVRKSSTGSTKYKPVYRTGTITSSGLSVEVVLETDPNVDL